MKTMKLNYTEFIQNFSPKCLADLQLCGPDQQTESSYSKLTTLLVNPIALRTAKTLWTFDRSEHNKVIATLKFYNKLYIKHIHKPLMHKLLCISSLHYVSNNYKDT